MMMMMIMMIRMVTMMTKWDDRVSMTKGKTLSHCIIYLLIYLFCYFLTFLSDKVLLHDMMIELMDLPQHIYGIVMM